MQRNLGKLLGKKLLPPNFRLLFLLSQFIFLATVRRKMNWKRCIFSASQIVAHSLWLPLCGKYSVVLNSKCLHFKYIVSKQQVSVRIIFSFDFSREIRPWNWPWQLVNTEHASLKKKSSVYVAYSKVLTNALYWYNHSVQKSPKSLILFIL